MSTGWGTEGTYGIGRSYPGGSPAERLWDEDQARSEQLWRQIRAEAAQQVPNAPRMPSGRPLAALESDLNGEDGQGDGDP